MVVTDNDNIADRVRLMRSHGMTSLTWDRHHGHAYSYDVVAQGYNYRIDEIRSALGIVQLAKLDRNNQDRRELTRMYRELLKDAPVTIPFENSSGVSACHIFPILLPVQVDRKRFIDRLRLEGIQTSIHYPPVHSFSYYRERYPGVALPITESIAAREVTLPLYPGMGPERVELVANAVQSALA